MSLIMTKAALALQNAENNFKFVKFESYKPKKKETSTNVEKSDSLPEGRKFSNKDLDLKKIRHEVVKFGMSGFDPTKKQEAKIALAVSLAKGGLEESTTTSRGAKPPKREYVNYKELMQKRKQEKLVESEEKQLMKSKSILQTAGKKKKKGVNNDVGHFLDSYGKVQKKDLKKKEKGSKKKKKIL